MNQMFFKEVWEDKSIMTNSWLIHHTFPWKPHHSHQHSESKNWHGLITKPEFYLGHKWQKQQNKIITSKY